MKVTIDNILGSARRINNQRQPEDDSADKKKKDVKLDSVNIENRLSSRLDTIENDLRDIQVSLTKNQIVRDGIGELQEDLQKGGKGSQKIMDEVAFQGEPVLRKFVGERLDQETLTARKTQIEELINGDVSRLKRLQVEIDNITASNLIGSEKLEKMTSNMESVFENAGKRNLDTISHLRADVVMRLVK